MPARNAEVATVLEEIADLLEVEGDNPYRVRAYRNAARSVAVLGSSIHGLVAEGAALNELPDIGPELAMRIAEIVRTGSCPLLERLHRELPETITELLKVPGIGPKRVHQLYTRLGIRSLEDLHRAAQQGRVRSVPGFGALIERRVLEATAAHRVRSRRWRRPEVLPIAESLTAYLSAMPEVEHALVAGSLRRGRDTVGDLDLVVSTFAASEVVERLGDHEEVQEVLSSGPARASVLLHSGLQVDLRAADPSCLGAAWLYLTGSKAHNVALRRHAAAIGLKLDERGLHRGRRRIAGDTELSIYEALGLPLLPPELREDRGELEAARLNRLPHLIEREHLRGDLHIRSAALRAPGSLPSLIATARALGLDYLAIADAASAPDELPRMDAEALARQADEIDRINASLQGFRLLKGVEVDILEDGRLALPDRLLARLDLVIGSVRTHLGLSRDQQTERLRRAMDNRHFSVLAHPTGRLLGERTGCDLDLQAVVRHAKARGCHLELNAQPLRLDLDDAGCQLARDAGVLVSISSAAADAAGLVDLDAGVLQARRGWLEPADVLNARPLEALTPLLRRTMV